MLLLNKYNLLIIVAGLINGSYVIPTKYMVKMTDAKIWLCHSVMNVLLLPWLFLAILLPSGLTAYSALSDGSLVFIIIAGLIFGMGQVCFAYAIKRIGISLDFSINIGISIALGSLYFVFFNHAFLSSRGLLITSAISLVLLGLFLNYLSSKQNGASLIAAKSYRLGWLLAFLAGLASGLQSIAFGMVALYSSRHMQQLNPFWIWPPFLLAAAVPMVLSFYRDLKQVSRAQHQVLSARVSCKNYFLVMIMGLCFTGSLWLYSSGMHHLNHEAQLLGWPLFMIFIILTSQVWGIVYKEIQPAFSKSFMLKGISMVFLLSAILVLGMT